MVAVGAAKANSGVLHSVRAVQYPALTSPAARILAESSPMYAWIDDTVPQKFRKDAAWRLARFRMPLVLDHLRVVVRTKDPLQEEEVQAKLAALSGQSSAVDYADIFDQPLEIGQFEVVAIYALLPPEAPAKQAQSKSMLQAWADAVLYALYRRPRQLLAKMLARVFLFAGLLHYGISVIAKMMSWIENLNNADKVSRLSDTYDSRMYQLQTMCVAANQQRQGLGSSVMDLAKQEVLEMKIPGMMGLCQSNATRDFYEKQGFASRDVFTHPVTDFLEPGIRKHFLVTWHAVEAATGAG